MRKAHLSLFLFFMTITSIAQHDVGFSNDSVDFDIKAKYKNENLYKFISDNIRYPREAIENDIQGYVILSFVITSEGKIDSIIPIEFPNTELAISSILAIQETDGDWNPTIINGNPIDWKYKLAIKFSIYKDMMPPGQDYISKANNFYKKEKYEKAIKYYNMAIAHNKYEYDYYLKRSSALLKIGNTKDGNEDITTMYRLYNEYIGTMEISAIGITRSMR